jgi:hypothetical protein
MLARGITRYDRSHQEKPLGLILARPQYRPTVWMVKQP